MAGQRSFIRAIAAITVAHIFPGEPAVGTASALHLALGRRALLTQKTPGNGEITSLNSPEIAKLCSSMRLYHAKRFLAAAFDKYEQQRIQQRDDWEKERERVVFVRHYELIKQEVEKEDPRFYTTFPGLASDWERLRKRYQSLPSYESSYEPKTMKEIRAEFDQVMLYNAFSNENGILAHTDMNAVMSSEVAEAEVAFSNDEQSRDSKRLASVWLADSRPTYLKERTNVGLNDAAEEEISFRVVRFASCASVRT